MKRALVLTAILAALVGLAFLVARPHVPDPAIDPAPYLGVRGASRARAAGLAIHFSRNGAGGPANPGTVLRAGDRLRFVVRGERPRQLEVRMRDGDAAPATIFPGAARETAEVRPRDELSVQPTLGAGGTKVIVTALFSDRPRLVGTPPDADTEVVNLVFAKE